MAIRVPVLGMGMSRSVALIYRLDTSATAAADPPGDPTSGYDPDFNEPVAYDSAGERTSSRREMSPVRVPCQIETPNFEHQQQFGPGIVENTVLVVVTHREDLDDLGLIDATTRQPLLKKGDRVAAIERDGYPGTIQQPLAGDGLYVLEVRPASWGFGSEGHDLELLFLEDRANAAKG